jgi:hypothetical protein
VTPSPNPIASTDAAASGESVGQGRYVIVGVLGSGSQGETLDAVDKREGRPVAIKRFTLRGAKSWKDVELAEREAAVLASLHHSGLPRYVEHFEEDGALYLVMEKIEGETLYSRRKRGASLDQAQVVRFLRDAGTCLQYLHSQAPPVVHRDIKPGNVILRPDGSYCLVDFGSVRDRLKPEGGSTVVGTFGYMAPEQFQGRAAPGSDVYAVGATALSLLTGCEPEDLPHKGLAVDVEAALRGQVDRRLAAALRSMLEPDPDRRASSVLDALRAAGLNQDSWASQSDTAGRASGSTGGNHASASAAELKAARRARVEAEAQRVASWAEELAERERRRAERAQEHWQHQRNRHERRRAEREERRAYKAARRAARRADRDARHYAEGWRGPRPRFLPGVLIGVVILVALRIASIATFALFQVLLPLLFTLLHRPRARERMLEVGEVGQRGLLRARQHVRYLFLGGAVPTELEHFVGDDDAFLRDAAPASHRARQRVVVDTDVTEPEHEAAEAKERDVDVEPDPKRTRPR